MIQLEHVSLTLAHRRILDDVSFVVAPGEAVALVGANGSGKTSVLRCVLGLVPCTGTIRVAGHDIAREPVLARARLAYLPQRAGFGDATAIEALRFVAALRGIDARRAEAILAEVGLAAARADKVRAFSGGMHQRLLLAIALVSDAEVLLFDEPTASLDVGGQAAFVETVARLRQDGRTLLLASHRDSEIAALTDRVLSLEAGRVGDATALAPVMPLHARKEMRHD